MVYRRPDGRYSENWNKLRFAVFERFNYRCFNCGCYSKGNLHLHHKIPLGCGGTNAINNLIPLCSTCHYNVHFNRQ